MSVRVDVRPELLDWAVERAGWDTETRDRRVPKWYEWHEGNIKPTLIQLQEFARKTHAPLGMLFLDTPPHEVLPIPDMRTHRDEGVAQPSANLLDTIYLCQNRQAWYRDYMKQEEAGPNPLVGSSSLKERPESAAQIIRPKLGFDDRSEYATWEKALRGLIDRVESLDVLVMVSGIVGSNTHRPLDPDEFRGFALVDPWASVIFINGADSKAAQIFTLVHELGHVLLGSSALSDADMKNGSDLDVERWCNRFAAELLVPISELRSVWAADTSVTELQRLSKRFRVSTLVVLKRVFDAGLIPWEEYRALYTAEAKRVKEIFDRGRSKDGGNYYNTQPLRVSRTFAKSVIEDTLSGRTAYRDAYKMLGTAEHATFMNLAAELGVG